MMNTPDTWARDSLQKREDSTPRAHVVSEVVWIWSGRIHPRPRPDPEGGRRLGPLRAATRTRGVDRKGGQRLGPSEPRPGPEGLTGRGAAFGPSLSPNPSRAGRAGVADGAAVQEPGRGCANRQGGGVTSPNTGQVPIPGSTAKAESMNHASTARQILRKDLQEARLSEAYTSVG